MPDDKQRIIETARKRFNLVLEVESDQRRNEREDLRFQVPELQWDDSARAQRQGGYGTAGVPIPPRPCLSIPKLNQPMDLVRNQFRNSRLGVNIHPISEDADDDTAEVLQGLYRDIERRSRADIARYFAFDRALQSGRGYYRIINRLDEDTDEPTDQRICIERILYQEQVYLDPSAIEPDWSDGKWAMLTEWVPRDVFEERFPKAKIPAAEDFQGDTESAPKWVKGAGDGEEEAVLVAEYFEKPLPSDKDKRLIWRKITGCEVLEEQRWNGRLIPIIPVAGQELQVFDGKRRWQGMVRPARDSQKGYNYAVSAAIEGVALEPKAPFLVGEGQIEGYEEMWQQSNTRNFPYLVYKQTLVDGTPAPPPQRAQADGSKMQLASSLAQLFDQTIQSTTATPDSALGMLDPKARSGRAILALQGQADASNAGYIGNMASVSILYEARVVLDMIPAIYDRPGRVVRTLDDEDNQQTLMVNAPFVEDPRSKRPVLSEEGVKGAKNHDLTKGRYGVSVSVGKSYQTRLQQGADEIGQILQADPSMMLLIGDLYFNYRDFPASKAIAERLKKVIESKYPGLTGKEGAPDPEQMQAQLQAAQQKMQEMQAQLGMAAEAIKTQQVKAQGDIQKVQMQAQADLQKAQAQAQVDMLTAQLEAKTKLEVANINAVNRKDVEELKSRLDLALALLEHKAKAIETAQTQAHEVEMQARQISLQPEEPGESERE